MKERRDRRIDRDSWAAPAAPGSPAPGRVRGALGGSLLERRPELAETVAAARAFLAGEGPVNLEIGVDRAERLLACAAARPDQRWLGLDIRRDLLAVAEKAPPNALLLRLDARTALAAVIPPGRLARVDILFPTPSHDPRHLLLTPTFIEDLARALAPGGIAHLATDLPGMRDLIAERFAGWARAPDPAPDPLPSRRERRCAAEGRPVWRWTFRKGRN